MALVVSDLSVFVVSGGTGPDTDTISALESHAIQVAMRDCLSTKLYR
jgi:hypothetical protein